MSVPFPIFGSGALFCYFSIDKFNTGVYNLNWTYVKGWRYDMIGILKTTKYPNATVRN